MSAAFDFMEDERAREQSLNVRGSAIAAAALASLALLGPSIEAVVAKDFARGAGHRALVADAGFLLLAAAVTIGFAVRSVLMPSPRGALATKDILEWTEELRLKDTEGTARFQILRALTQTIESRRSVNEKKAIGLRIAYYAFLVEIVLAAVAIATLGLA